MFKCELCRNIIGPNVKPVKVITGIRHTEYHNKYTVEDEWGNKEQREVDSRGTEITGEALACGPCTGTQPANAPATQVLFLNKHEEKLAEPFQVKLVAHVLDTARRRIAHKSKRADRDIAVAVPAIKRFSDDNKGLVV